jgi:hypothetical protein
MIPQYSLLLLHGSMMAQWFSLHLQLHHHHHLPSSTSKKEWVDSFFLVVTAPVFK